MGRYRLAYFGWSIEFTRPYAPAAAIRAEANARVIEQHGKDASYVEPGLPFPDFVPVQMWDGESEDFFPLS